MLTPVKKKGSGMLSAAAGEVGEEAVVKVEGPVEKKDAPAREKKPSPHRRVRGTPRQKGKSSPPRLSIELTPEQERKLKKMVKAENTYIKDFVLDRLGLLDID